MTDQALSVEQLRQQIAQCRAALQERDLRYRTLLYNLPEEVVHKDRDSVYLSCNKNFAGDFGMTPEQMVGKADFDLYPHDPGWRKSTCRRPAVLGLGRGRGVRRTLFDSTAEESIVRTVKAPVKDEQGNVTGILGIFSDITARKQAEEGLRNSERTLRTLIDASPESIMLLDTEGTILFANEGLATRRLGRTVDEITGQNRHPSPPPRGGRQ